MCWSCLPALRLEQQARTGLSQMQLQKSPEQYQKVPKNP